MKNIYGFMIGDNKNGRVVDIESSSERKAIEILIKNYWDLIAIYGDITLLGMRIGKYSGENNDK